MDWLKTIHLESHGNSDLVAHFFRRAFELLNNTGTFGLISTNTISQGDTRTTGLRWIAAQGGLIYEARKRYKWPGLASVIVSIVWISKYALYPPFELNGNLVDGISAYLFHKGGSENPKTLQINTWKKFYRKLCTWYGFYF